MTSSPGTLADLPTRIVSHAGALAGVIPVALDAPDWVAVAICVCGTALGMVRAVVPQESPDRLAWWRTTLDWRLRRNGGPDDRFTVQNDRGRVTDRRS